MSSASLPDRESGPNQRLSARRDRRPPGGIAQLVERQLCKLDAAGSNPAASTTLRKRAAGGFAAERACSSVG